MDSKKPPKAIHPDKMGPMKYGRRAGLSIIHNVKIDFDRRTITFPDTIQLTAGAIDGEHIMGRPSELPKLRRLVTELQKSCPVTEGMEALRS